MTKKSTPPPRFAPLQRLTADPITDPAEQAAALDELRRQQRQPGPPIRTRGVSTVAANGSASRVLGLFQQLPEAERAPLLARWMTQLSADAQLEVLELLAAQLSPEDFHQVEEELQQRVAPLTDAE